MRQGKAAGHTSDPAPHRIRDKPAAMGRDSLFRLSRTVRLSLAVSGHHASATPRNNPFAAWPTEESWAVHLEVVIAVRGEPDSSTGYVVDIGAVDQAVRDEVLRPGVFSSTPAALLLRLHRVLPEALQRHVDHVRLQLSPRYSLEMAADRPDCVLLRQSFEFAASHRLHCDELDAERNRLLFGKCNNQNGHGHNYRVEVAVETPLAGATDKEAPSPGLRDIEAVVRREVIERFDHKHLNLDTTEFAHVNPSVERIAQVCHGLLVAPLAAIGGRLHRVAVWETEKTCCEYPVQS